MRRYYTSSNTDAHFRVARSSNQYLLHSSEVIELTDIVESEVNSEFFLLEESGNITKGLIQPDLDNQYTVVYLNGRINEEEISWKEAEEIISAI